MSASPPQLEEWLLSLQWVFLLYFILLNGGYIGLNLLSLFTLRRYLDRHSFDHLPRTHSGFDPPVSVLAELQESQPWGEDTEQMFSC